jgi:hypothetical protein
MLQAIETTVGASAILLLRSGARPTNLTDASTGTVLSTINLPADYMAAPANGVVAMQGTWQDTSADAAGTIGHYELRKSDTTTITERGTVTATGGGGDLQVDNTVVAAAQQVTITAWSRTAGNP